MHLNQRYFSDLIESNLTRKSVEDLVKYILKNLYIKMLFNPHSLLPDISQKFL